MESKVVEVLRKAKQDFFANNQVRYFLAVCIVCAIGFAFGFATGLSFTQLDLIPFVGIIGIVLLLVIGLSFLGALSLLVLFVYLEVLNEGKDWYDVIMILEKQRKKKEVRLVLEEKKEVLENEK